MKNERVGRRTLVRDRLRKLGYYDLTNSVKVDEQKSAIDDVTKFLKQASKAGGGGKGAPEFIISNHGNDGDYANRDFLVIVECKADNKDHASPALNAVLLRDRYQGRRGTRNKRVVRYAADGVLHYAKHLSRAYSVIALAVSGQTDKGLEVSTFLHPKDPKGKSRPRVLTAKMGAALNTIVPWDRSAWTFRPSTRPSRRCAWKS